MHAWLPPDLFELAASEAARQSVSAVARSPRGFASAFRRAGLDPDRLSVAWQRRREGFVKRHMAQVRANREVLFDTQGRPTRRHLALAVWGYSPAPNRLREALRRRNGTRAGLIDHLTQQCGLSAEDAERIAPKKDMISPRRALSPAQIALFEQTVRRLYAKDASMRTALLLLVRTGMRVSEICGARLDAVTASRRGNAQADIIGKGQKQRRVAFGRRGTALVASWLRVRPPTTHPYLLVGPRGGRMTPSAIQAACRRIAAEAGLKGLTPHVLRHSYASTALLRCWDLHTLQAQLGHGKVGSKRLPAVTLTYLDV